MYKIPLTRGMHTIVDAEDYETLRLYKWHAMQSGYAARRVGTRIILMHRVILNAPDGLMVDHINGDPTDNRRCNLRLATSQQNHFNRRPRKKATSQYKGVDWNSRVKRWRVQIYANGKHMTLGYFKTAEEAALVYNEAARKYFGEFAFLNEV